MMSNKITVPFFLTLAILAGGYAVSVAVRPEAGFPYGESSPVAEAVPPPPDPAPPLEAKAVVHFEAPGPEANIMLPKHVSQTFNNCGPATLSMMLAYYGVEKSQAELGKLMRPYQNARGDNDDKSTSSEEYVQWANVYGLQGTLRPAGNLQLIKTLVSNGFPVVVRSWLKPGQTISHYRIIRGYNDAKGVVIQDDSYIGKNIEFSYEDFMGMWQAFGYEYFVLYPEDKAELIAAIIGEDMDERKAWEKAATIAEQESANDPENIYPRFNLAVVHFHTGQYAEAAAEFEAVQGKLPARMLWYQYEPIQTYQKLGNKEKVFSLTNAIITNGNRAVSELYLIRGEMLMEEQNYAGAKAEFELAVKHKENYQPAITALAEVNDLLAKQNL